MVTVEICRVQGWEKHWLRLITHGKAAGFHHGQVIRAISDCDDIGQCNAQPRSLTPDNPLLACGIHNFT